MVQLEVVILVVQLALGALGGLVALEMRQMASQLITHEARLDGLEQFRAQGNRWTLTQQREHEAEVAGELKAIREDLAVIKTTLGVRER